MACNDQRRSGTEQAARDAPKAFTDHPPTVGKLTTAAEVMAQ